MIDQIPLHIDVEDIYFITGLSWRGDIVNLNGRASGCLNILDYIDIYFTRGTNKEISQILIKNKRTFPIKIILFTIVRVVALSTSHQASWLAMFLAVECLHPKVFEWWIGLLAYIKKQLSPMRRGKTENFCYGSILCSFFFERVLTLWPKVSTTISRPRDPRIDIWEDLIKCLGGGEVTRLAFYYKFFL